MKILKLYENFINNGTDSYNGDVDLSIEFENRLRSMSDEDSKKMDIDSFLNDYSKSNGKLTGYSWNEILKNKKRYEDLSDEEFEDVYNQYKINIKK